MKLFHLPKIGLTATKVPSVYGVYTIVKGNLQLFGLNIKMQTTVRFNQG